MERPEYLDKWADRLSPADRGKSLPPTYEALYLALYERDQTARYAKELERRIDDAITVMNDELDHGTYTLERILRAGIRIHRVGNEWLRLNDPQDA